MDELLGGLIEDERRTAIAKMIRRAFKNGDTPSVPADQRVIRRVVDFAVLYNIGDEPTVLRHRAG